MKLRKNVEVIEEQGNVIICLGKKKRLTTETDIYLVKAIKKEIYEEEKLKKLIMEHDNSNEIVAGLTLAKFILDYQPYIEQDKGYYEITM